MFEEIIRASSLQPHVLRRFQRLLRDEIQPMLDEREKLIEEVAGLRAQVTALEQGTRGPGRPKKVVAETVN
jgi:hypothetical protein